MRLSVLDQSPVPEGFTGADALHNTLDLAVAADEFGYHRYWVAEHHGGPMLASASPEALIGPIASATRSIRVGSGGVMLPHYSPLKVAETFTILSALYPGRIDLGIGRAAGTDPLTTFALQRDRRQAAPDDFPQQLAELMGYLEDDLPDDHPFARLAAMLPGRPATPDVWLLGSSPQSAIWAGQLGLPYAFADFINPGGTEIARLYRDRFTAVRELPASRTAVAVWVLCAPTDEEADYLASSSRMTLTLLRRGQLIPVPPPEKAMDFLRREGKLGPRDGGAQTGPPATAQTGPPDRAAQTAPRDGAAQPGQLPGRRGVIGSPEKVRAELEALAVEYGAEEVIAVTITHDHAARRRSYALLAEAFGLEPSSTRLAASANP